MHMNKADDCRQLLGQLEKGFPSSDAPALLRAALLQRGKQPKHCEELLEEAAAKAANPTSALLTLAQLHLDASQPERALSALKRISSLRGRSGMVATLVALHERIGDVDGAAASFAGSEEAQIVRASAAFFARQGLWAEAAVAHQKLLSIDPRDAEALAGLVIATSYTDSSLANEHFARLEMMCPPLDEGEPIDAEGLERAALPRSGKRGAGLTERKRMGEEEPGARAKKKRRRRKPPRYPKDFDPANPGPPPDPERWLPKRERSTYRQRRKDKRGSISRGPQGSATGAAKVDARTTTNIQLLSEAERAKLKAEQEVKERAEAAAAAAAASAKKKSKGVKGKGK